MITSISIIVPVYNVEPYIEECLQSVADQTMAEGIECIIIDDKGTDNSIATAENFVHTYSGPVRFSIIYHDKNRGLSAARNTGIKAARGEYIYFLDSDDTITPNCMELMYNMVEKYKGIDMVQGMFIITNPSLYRERNIFPLPEFTKNRKIIKSFYLSFRGDIVPAQTRLIRKSFIEKHNLFFMEGIIHEDNHWSFYLAKYIESLAYCREKTYFHRYNPSSISNDKKRDKEAFAYKMLICDFCHNLDPLLKGRQKELIMQTFLASRQYFSEDEKKNIYKIIKECNSVFENVILDLFGCITHKYIKEKVLHLLFRIYKIND